MRILLLVGVIIAGAVSCYLGIKHGIKGQEWREARAEERFKREGTF